MPGLSKDAFAVMAVCQKKKQPFGVTVDKVDWRHYRLMWAFKIDREKAHREGYDQKSVTAGTIDVDEKYPGCPHCGAKSYYICACGKMVCYNGQKSATCPECGLRGTISCVSEISIKGGGY